MPANAFTIQELVSGARPRKIGRLKYTRYCNGMKAHLRKTPFWDSTPAFDSRTRVTIPMLFSSPPEYQGCGEAAWAQEAI
jgi:hypothetical protein